MEKKEWTLPQLLQLSDAYWATCTLHAGVKLDVFTPLAAAPGLAGDLAGHLGCSERGMGMLLDALAALGLLNKKDHLYSATAFSAKYLSKRSSDYMGHIIMHHHHLVAGWGMLDQAVKTGRPVRQRSSHEDEMESRESFLMGMFNLAMQIAPRIVPQIDLSGRRRLLDLGGGPGTYAIHFCLQNPELSAVICDLPTTREFAEKTVAKFNLSGRIKFEAGDFEVQELPKGFDTAWLSHILHGVGPEICVEILKKTMRALDPGGMIMVQEFILDNDKDSPVFPALFSLNMLVGTPEGQSYSEEELMEMLKQAGAKEVRRIPLELPNGAGVVAGIV
ncbi:acetylserotonin O-methyltransferase [Geomonas sp. Red32]|uniref:acetylserotonin O-methyltransferase n=1 Tax=Geomonas sp. Red32 TaxID=2912856 RepID=UPI00202CFBB0|nr:acetylserotonin O-methyltransferase [Geomonas sp. Red32]MCM0083108.1 acetylserotonin O-methyltransferase [Geomonas sp. Red32]